MHSHRLGWTLALAIGLAVAAVALLQHAPAIFNQAHPIPHTRGIITNTFVESGYDFRRRFTLSWFLRSDQSIASFQRDTNGIIRLLHLRPDHPATPSLELPPPLVRRRDQPLIFWIPSPDGQWLLTVRRVDGLRLYQVYAADHSLHAQWTFRYEGRSQPDWLSNSRGFVEWPLRESKLLARVHWLDRADPTEIDLATLRLVPLDQPKPLPQPCIPVLFSPLSSEIIAEILILSPMDQPDQWKRAALQLPQSLRDSLSTTIFLAPTCDRIAWLVDSAEPIPRFTLSRSPPFLDLEPRVRTSLFVSPTDGTQLQFLGRTRLNTTVSALRWSPAGDALTFVYQDALWLQPLPRSNSPP